MTARPTIQSKQGDQWQHFESYLRRLHANTGWRLKIEAIPSSQRNPNLKCLYRQSPHVNLKPDGSQTIGSFNRDSRWVGSSSIPESRARSRATTLVLNGFSVTGHQATKARGKREERPLGAVDSTKRPVAKRRVRSPSSRVVLEPLIRAEHFWSDRLSD